MTSYDPNYCLAEHLNYFQENVAFDIAEDDFDVIFSNSEAMYPTTPQVPSKGSPFIVIEKVTIVPNPIDSPSTTSTPVPGSPVCVRQILNERAAKAMIESVMAHSAQSSPVSANKRVFEFPAPASCPLVPSPLVISDDESEGPSSSPSITPPSSVVSEDEAVPDPNTISIPVEFPQPTISQDVQVPQPFVSQDEVPSIAIPASTTATKTSRKRRMSGGPDVRRERNRLHAKKSRDRKREFNQCLHESVTALKEENEYLLSLLNQHSQRNGEPPVQPPKQEDGVEFIIASLQNPANRVLSDESLADLQSLFQC